MAKIGILFGTFSPLHNGHLMLASYLANNTFLDEVWLCPSPDSEFKTHEDGLMHFEMRVMLIRLACSSVKGVDCTTIEKNMPSPRYTINTLRELDKEFGNHGLNKFYPIFGADNIAKIETFHDFESILRDYEIFVLPREGHDIAHVLFTYGSATFHVVKDAPVCSLSSTFIRQQIKEGKDISAYVPYNSQLLLDI